MGPYELRINECFDPLDWKIEVDKNNSNLAKGAVDVSFVQAVVSAVVKNLLFIDIFSTSTAAGEPFSIMTSWIEQQKEAVLAKPLDPNNLTISLTTDRKLKQKHYKCGSKFITLSGIPSLPLNPQVSRVNSVNSNAT